MPTINSVVDEAVSYQSSKDRHAAEQDQKISDPLQRLQQTIRGLEKGIANNEDFIKHVRYPKTLVKALKELEVLIGNDGIKGDVADGVNNIIMNKLLHHQNPKIKLEEAMLNIALYGPPGVGKTTIGAKLAKIVYALGYLNERSEIVEREAADLLDFMGQNYGQSDASIEWISMIVAIFYVVMVVLIIVSVSKSAFSDLSWAGTIILMVLLILVVGICSYALWPKNSKGDKMPAGKKATHNVDLKIEDDKPTGVEDQSEDTDDAVAEKKVPDEPEISDDELLTVVTRTDLVSRYVGNSDKDTLLLLKKNMGKVLFIDEAYQLYDNESAGGDKYGAEVLNVLNQFLSEHPKDIVVIFAGYKDKMYDTIFKAQPGLERRVMWHFNCKGYTGEELYRILAFMCKQRGWAFKNPEEVRDLIINYEDLFRNYGGDMEKVGLFSRSAYNSEMIDPTVKDKPVPGFLETRHVLSGIKKLQENSENAAGSRKQSPQQPIDPDQLNAVMSMLKQPAPITSE